VLVNPVLTRAAENLKQEPELSYYCRLLPPRYFATSAKQNKMWRRCVGVESAAFFVCSSTQGMPSDDPYRVPRVYLGSAFWRFFSVLLFCSTYNLRIFNALNSSIPTAPTIHLPDG
jgi:hypothetical protein